MFTFCSSKSGLSVKRGISNELQFSVKRCFSVKHQFSATRRFSRTNSKIFNRKCCERSFVLDSFRENRIQVFNFCSFFWLTNETLDSKSIFEVTKIFGPTLISVKRWFSIKRTFSGNPSIFRHFVWDGYEWSLTLVSFRGSRIQVFNFCSFFFIFLSLQTNDSLS